MSKINLSKVEIPKRSKSMSLHPPPEINNLSIKQIGDYALGEEIGSGAFGKVVLGKHILTGEKVAIKILDKMILNQTPEDYELVKKEISILKLVKHKFIVQLYEIMQTAQHIFIIMEYCEGKEIMDYILTKTRLSELESLKYFQQLINTLFYLHSQNIAHRDVKIDNILLDKNHDLKLIDFGLSTKYTDDSLLDQPCGTIVYAAPEVLEGKEYHGMLADVWSSGIVLFGMLAGFLPFSDKNDEVNKKQVIKGEIKFPDFFPDLVTDLLKHMLDVDPMTRYTLQEIKDHPWFNSNDYILIPGIIIDYNIIPVDEKILNLCVTYNKDKNEVFDSVRNNKHDSNSALYYLLVKKLKKKGFKSVSDLCSDDFIDYILDEHNLINQEENNDNNDNIDDNGDNCDNTNSKTNIEENKEEEIIFSNDNIDNIDNVEFIEQNVEKEKNERENIDRNQFKDEEINI
jgi:5'-AMP-activated protein kinase catalytic alpha subunit